MISVDQFSQLRLPDRSAGEMLHLGSAAGFCLSANDAISVFDLKESHFADPKDMERARRSNQLWMWEERTTNDTDTPTLIRASSSLVRLLGNAPGAGPGQRLALETFEALFPTYSLCFNDYLLSGYASAEEYLSKGVALDAFQSDEDELEKAADTNSIWTLVEQVSSSTYWGAANLETLLRRAFENHPLVLRHRALEEALTAPSPRKTNPRF